MKETSSISGQPTNLIYSLQCPVCGRANLDDAPQCWHCHYQFPEPERKRVLFSGAEKVLIGLTIFLVAVVAILRFLAS
jgi:hypothetical protein